MAISTHGYLNAVIYISKEAHGYLNDVALS
jgi:hypothetical protein